MQWAASQLVTHPPGGRRRPRARFNSLRSSIFDISPSLQSQTTSKSDEITTDAFIIVRTIIYLGNISKLSQYDEGTSKKAKKIIENKAKHRPKRGVVGQTTLATYPGGRKRPPCSLRFVFSLIFD